MSRHTIFMPNCYLLAAGLAEIQFSYAARRSIQLHTAYCIQRNFHPRDVALGQQEVFIYIDCDDVCDREYGCN